MTSTCLIIHYHLGDIPRFVTMLGHYLIVFGIPWLQQHHLCLRFPKNQVTFNSNYCLSHSLYNAILVQGTTLETPPLHLNSMARPLGHTMLDGQETRKVIPPACYNFLPLFLKEGSRRLPPKPPGIDHKINIKPNL
jgi:hypothetical protein